MRYHFGRILLLLLCLGVVCNAGPASGQVVDDTLRADIKKMLDVTGAAKMGVQMAGLVSSQVFAGLRKSQPALPERAVQLAQQVLDSEFAKAFEGPDSLMEQLVPIYAKHFTREEIRGLLAFYETDLGKKTIAVLPAIMQEAAAVGQEWAERETPRIMALLESRLRAEGFIK